MIKCNNTIDEKLKEYNKFFDANELMEKLEEKNLCKTVENLLLNEKYQELLNLCYDRELTDLFLYIYINCDVVFDSKKTIYQEINQMEHSKCTDANDAKVESENSINNHTQINIYESKNKMDLIKNFVYLKRYSRVKNTSLYYFVKKYKSRVNYERFYNTKMQKVK